MRILNGTATGLKSEKGVLDAKQMTVGNEDLPYWKDFPKGLRVIVAVKDHTDFEDIKCILERCQYQVTAFETEEDALEVLASDKSKFHAALIEGSSDSKFDGFKIMEAAKEIPTIMISSTDDISIMMKGISLGAADFIHKPYTEEKIRNIWQHVARKVLVCKDEPMIQTSGVDANSCANTDNYKQNVVLKSAANDERACAIAEESSPVVHLLNKTQENEIASDFGKDRADSIPVQNPEVDPENKDGLTFYPHEEGCISLDVLDLDDSFDGIVLDGEGNSCFDLDQAIFGLPDSDSDSALEMEMNFGVLDSTDIPESDIDKEEAMLLADVLKPEEEGVASNASQFYFEAMQIEEFCHSDEAETKPSRTGAKAGRHAAGRKKMKVDWTAELHQKFVQAVEQLGVDKAIPSRILDLMGVKCLTRHNIASHLQKYRSHRKHLLLREAEAAANWHNRRTSDSTYWGRNRRDGTSWLAPHQTSPTPIQPRPTPILPAPPPPSVHPSQPLLVWGHPTTDHSSIHIWQQPPTNHHPPTWQAPDGTIWQHPAACTWAHPVHGTPIYPHNMRLQQMNPVVFPPPLSSGPVSTADSYTNSPSDCHPPTEVVNAVISEALSNRCKQPPLGLKSPSMESVMAELQRQGINIVPPAPS